MATVFWKSLSVYAGGPPIQAATRRYGGGFSHQPVWHRSGRMLRMAHPRTAPRLELRRSRPLLVGTRSWVVAIGTAGVLLTAVSVSMATRVNRDPWWVFCVAELIGLSFQLCGLFVWIRGEAYWVGP